MLFISTFYYGICGPWYWLEYRDGLFLGVSWGNELDRMRDWYVGIFVLVSVGIALVNRVTYPAKLRIESDQELIQINSGMTYKALLLLGLVASAYVLIRGGSLADGASLTDDPLLLILYQFSDILIAIVLFLISVEGLTKRNITYLFLFVMYGAFVGLRYKVLLVAAPVLIYMFVVVGRNRLPVKVAMVLVGICFIGILSLLTIARTKFSGIDVDALSNVEVDDLLHGLFAETNIVFGLAASLNTFGTYREFVGFSPLIDSIVQFVPRFLYPDKSLYSNLDGMLYGLGDSLEAYQSATMMPFFAEYYSMGGMLAVAIGLLSYIVISSVLIVQLRRVAPNFRSLVIGGTLISIFIAYYYYSRGSIPQIFKGIIFICIPYLYLLKHQIRRN